ncbi:MAG TPA: hypothetical protein VF313_04510 [Anaerolineaceae bacterium]
MNNPPKLGTPLKISLIILVIAGILLTVCLAAGAVFLIQSYSQGEPAPKTPAIQTPPLTQETNQTLGILQQNSVPNANWLDIASRLQGKKNVPAVISNQPPQYKMGAQQEFWVFNDDTSAHFKVNTTLAYITDHVYLWVQDGINITPDAAKQLGDIFESKIYPTVRAFFGSEWTPGVDNDPHLYIVDVRGLSGHAGAYFSSEDEINPVIDPYSNGHELFVVNAQYYPTLNSDVYGVLAHEFQHMIEYNQHRDMVGWMNEGFSVLATYINGYGTGGYDQNFIPQPDLQLNDFPNDPNNLVPHYGASFMFLDYFLSRFGEQATQQLAKDPADGLDAVDATLKQTGARDGLTAQPIKADDVFADWAVANYLGDSSLVDGRFAYSNFPAAPLVRDTDRVSRCPEAGQNKTVHQYGTDYIHISCRGNYTLNFLGSPGVSVLPVNPHSGSYEFWSSKGDESDMTLTQAFDFSTVNGSVSMTYWTWYDTEKNFDYAYLVASTDDQNWEMVKTTSGTTDNPGNNNLGIGYNGNSGGWIKETVDLSKYAGKKVQLRFEYITDAQLYGEGFLLDDVSIPQIGYQTDFEKDDGGWIAQGFVRIQNYLPQTYRLTLIDLGSPKSVRYLSLNSDQSLNIPLNLANDVILVVSGTTRYTRQLASYAFSIK